MKRLGILISGRGSNCDALAQAVADGRIRDAEIAVVLSNRSSAAGLEAARTRGLDAVSIPSLGQDRIEYDRKLIAELKSRRVDLVCLAGFMRLLSAEFIPGFRRPNPEHPPVVVAGLSGLDAQHQALQHGVKIAGCTVHFVDEQLDSGPIILQAAVPVHDGDTVDTLSTRILAEEHRIYPQAVDLVVSGKYRLEGRRVVAKS